LADYCNDSLSMRSVLNAGKMLAVGIPLEAVVYALTIDQKPELRRQIGVMDFDVMTFGEAPESGYHRALPYLAKLIEADVPIFLKGLAGFGKSFMAEQLADYMGREYRETPVSPGAMRSDLFGKDTLKRFVEAGYAQMYERGGFFNFEEIDAAPPGILITINNSIANGKLDNPNSGEVVKRHENFRALATGNTWGGGATAEFAGRERQDGATLDRFRAGRVEIPLDPELESDLFHKIVNGE
jgi:cobaltochelatase CobS